MYHHRETIKSITGKRTMMKQRKGLTTHCLQNLDVLLHEKVGHALTPILTIGMLVCQLFFQLPVKVLFLKFHHSVK